MFTPELLLQVEPAPATLTVPCEPAPLPMLAVKAVILMTIPPFVIVSVPVPKLPILSPPPGPLFQMEPGPVTVTVPVEPADNPTEPPPPLFTVPPFWMVSVPVPRPPTTTPPIFVHVEPAPDTITVPRRARQIANSPAEIGQGPAGLDNEHSCPVLTDGKIQGGCARAPDLRRIRRHSVNVCAGRCRGNTGVPIARVKPAIGERSGPVGLGVCRNRRCCDKRDCRQQSGRDKFAAGARPRRRAAARSYGRQSMRFAPHLDPQSIGNANN